MIEKKRRQAYLGSRMHFIRSMYNNQLKKDGFSLLNLPRMVKDNSGMVVDTEDGKSIFLESRLAVIYKGNSNNITFLNKNKNFTPIDKNGFYDPGGISWSGGMASQRMGDLLPFEYEDPRSRKP